MDHDLPRRAVAAFERATGLGLTIRDLRGSIAPALEATRTEHVHPACRQAKDSRHGACIAFCGARLVQAAERFPSGLVKRCHAGCIEMSVPVAIDGALEWVISAGVRRAGPGLEVALADPAGSRLGPLAGLEAALKPIGRDEADHVLELLHQLAARLVAWRRDAGGRIGQPSGPEVATAGRRRQQIAWLIAKRHPDPAFRLADLAGHLGLSEDRAGHVVRELCGDGFAALVQRERLRTAQALLDLGRLPLREVMRRSGFASRSQFFAAFRSATGLTPGAYRRRTART